MSLSRFKASILCIGDILLLYLSLALALFVRYNVHATEVFALQFSLLLSPFTIIFLVWVVVFYLADLYDPKNLKNDLDFYRSFLTVLFINALLATAFFYVFTFYGIAPKVILFILLAIFAATDLIWRYLFNRYSGAVGTKENVFMIIPNDKPEMANEVIDFIKTNPQLGYDIKYQLKEGQDYRNLSNIIKDNNIDLIVIPTRCIKQNPGLAKEIYLNLSLGIGFMNLSEFYGSIFRKIPLSELEETWFLEHIVHPHHFFDVIKRFFEFVEALVLIILLSPIFLLIVVLVKLTSSGPAVYKQIRVGKNEKLFTLYKFRTMRTDAEKSGPQWSQGSDDPRVTKFGRFLRYSHLDEMPQLFNILKGDIYFIGPRPERPEFVKQLKERIPYYDIRHLISPGISGWAQINYRYGATVEDAVQKLQYEIYYMENRSFVFDLVIVAKTIKMLFLNFQ